MTRQSPAPRMTDLFREFYGLAADLRRRAESGSSGQDLEALRQPLMSFLEGLEADGDRSADAVALREARYAMAVFADDQFTAFDWPLRDAWKAAALESTLFQTHEGGSEIFRRIDKLLQVGDPGQKDIAGLYLLALSLGFRGDLEPASAERSLRSYRRRLLDFAAPGRPGADASRSLSPAAYLHTVGRALARPLPGVRKWAWFAFGTVLLLLLTSNRIWNGAVRTIADIVDSPISATR